nr:disease resistance rpp13-like protein 4 [Quercus suber]
MSSSDYKQTNPGETLPFTKIVQTIDNLIEHHPILKSKPSLEHRPIFESKPSLETTTATTSGNGSPKVEIKSEGKGSSEGGKEDSKIDSQLLEKIQNNLNQIKDSFIQLKRFGESELAKQLKTCLSDLDPRELRTGYGILVKGNEKSSKKSPSQEKLVALFNLNDPSPDVKLNSLAKDVDWLSKMKTIKVLYLGRWQKSAGYHIEVKSTEFLKELTTMEELRFLSLQGISRINKLPRSIGMLKNLVVLDLKDCNNLEELPEEISKLKKLRYLDISHCYVIEDLKGLKKLKKLTIIATRKDFPTPEDLAAFLELKALRKLTIAWGVQPKKSEEQAKAGELSKHETSPLGKAAASSVRLSDKLPNKLEKLDLQCFPYSTPTWLKPGDLPMLEKLYVRGGNFATLEKDTWKVKALRLKYLSGMKTIWRELKELFPDLVYLERVKCPGITLCPCDENGVWQNPKT